MDYDRAIMTCHALTKLLGIIIIGHCFTQYQALTFVNVNTTL